MLLHSPVGKKEALLLVRYEFSLQSLDIPMFLEPIRTFLVSWWNYIVRVLRFRINGGVSEWNYGFRILDCLLTGGCFNCGIFHRFVLGYEWFFRFLEMSSVASILSGLHLLSLFHMTSRTLGV